MALVWFLSMMKIFRYDELRIAFRSEAPGRRPRNKDRFRRENRRFPRFAREGDFAVERDDDARLFSRRDFPARAAGQKQFAHGKLAARAEFPA